MGTSDEISLGLYFFLMALVAAVVWVGYLIVQRTSKRQVVILVGTALNIGESIVDKMYAFLGNHPRRVVLSLGFVAIAYFCFSPPMRNARYSGQVIDFPALFMRIAGVAAVTCAAFVLVPRPSSRKYKSTPNPIEDLP